MVIGYNRECRKSCSSAAGAAAATAAFLGRRRRKRMETIAQHIPSTVTTHKSEHPNL